MGTHDEPDAANQRYELLISNMARRNYMGSIVMPTPDGATATYEYQGVMLPNFTMRTTPNEPNRRLGDLGSDDERGRALRSAYTEILLDEG